MLSTHAASRRAGNRRASQACPETRDQHTQASGVSVEGQSSRPSLIQRLSHLRWEKTENSSRLFANPEAMPARRSGHSPLYSTAACPGGTSLHQSPKRGHTPGQARLRSPPRPPLSKLLVVGLNTRRSPTAPKKHATAKRGHRLLQLLQGAVRRTAQHSLASQLWEDAEMASAGARNDPRRAWPQPWSMRPMATADPRTLRWRRHETS